MNGKKARGTEAVRDAEPILREEDGSGQIKREEVIPKLQNDAEDQTE